MNLKTIKIMLIYLLNQNNKIILKESLEVFKQLFHKHLFQFKKNYHYYNLMKWLQIIVKVVTRKGIIVFKNRNHSLYTNPFENYDMLKNAAKVVK